MEGRSSFKEVGHLVQKSNASAYSLIWCRLRRTARSRLHVAECCVPAGDGAHFRHAENAEAFSGGQRLCLSFNKEFEALSSTWDLASSIIHETPAVQHALQESSWSPATAAPVKGRHVGFSLSTAPELSQLLTSSAQHAVKLLWQVWPRLPWRLGI